MSRYQRGSVVLLAVNPASKTDRLPVATITTPSGTTLAVVPIPLSPGSGPLTYVARFRLPAGLALGTYGVSISYAIAGTQTTSSASFDLAPGGDSGGEIISMFGYDRPEGRYVLAQLGSGRLVQGLNPYL